VCTDRGLEYADLDKWCHQEGIKQHMTVAYKSAQIGRAERFNRTLSKRVEAMLTHDQEVLA
jgi:transposase InsO family protein